MVNRNKKRVRRVAWAAWLNQNILRNVTQVARPYTANEERTLWRRFMLADQEAENKGGKRLEMARGDGRSPKSDGDGKGRLR